MDSPPPIATRPVEPVASHEVASDAASGTGESGLPPDGASPKSPVVLVVDDDLAIRAVAVMMLELVGFKTLQAGNGLEALKQLEQHPDVAAVLLDMLMPVMDGAETFHAMRQIYPEVPVIIVSGLAPADITARIGDPAPAALVQKPFTLAGLTGVLRTVLH